MTQANPVHDFARVIQSLCHEGDSGRNRRNEWRHARSLSLKIQPIARHSLTFELYDDGESFWAISRDISGRGLAFINSSPISHEYLRIGLLDRDVSAIGQVRHITSIGDRYPLYLVGIEFLDIDPF